MEETTLAIAVFGAVTGAASLGWGIASYILSGGRVKVELVGGWLGPGLLAAPLTASLAQQDARFDQPVLAVRVRNLGRLPITVESWSVKVGQLGVAMFQHPTNAGLPCTVTPGGKAETWVVPLEEIIRAVVAASGTGIRTEDLRATVTLGSGKERHSKRATVGASELPARFDL